MPRFEHEPLSQIRLRSLVLLTSSLALILALLTQGRLTPLATIACTPLWAWICIRITMGIGTLCVVGASAAIDRFCK